MLQAQQMRQMKVISSTNKDFWSEQKIKICNSSVMTTNVMLRHCCFVKQIDLIRINKISGYIYHSLVLHLQIFFSIEIYVACTLSTLDTILNILLSGHPEERLQRP